MTADLNTYYPVIIEKEKTGAPVITVERLVKHYKKATNNAVDDISFSVQPGSFFALLGPNGAGKTTTISILTTTLLPTSGRVSIAGYDLENEPNKVRDELGIIFQKPSLDLHLTAEENIRFHAMLYGIYPFRPSFNLMPKSYQKQVLELAQIVGMEHLLHKKVKTFSGGMQRKLEIMRSLLHRPKVLFLDEPTAGLDADSRRNLWEYLQKVRDEHGTTVFLTTHYLEEAELADDVCIINQGKIVAQGSPAQLKTQLINNYLTIEAHDRQALRTELDRLQIPFDGHSPLKLWVEDARMVHELLRRITTPLSHIETYNPSLEEAYLEIVRNTNA
ncbi:MAG TPA: ATP-binding cassette domain-containing protein [Chloroflexia bacterium]|nr:ATP-binding cassette domain-containing protein [Chloroflexia bacterium]